jgi:hypothetical protein
LKGIIAAYTPEDYSYEPTEGSRKAKRSDYDDVDVIPVSDPNASTMAQKIVQYQAVMQLAQQSPQLYNMPLLHRQMLDVLGIKEAAKLVPMDEDQKPTDPVSENQNVLMMKPVKAFMYQDHQAHIMVHMSAMQDPKIMSLLQNNPMAQQLQSAMMAHVNEHLGFEYRKQIEQQLGMSLPAQKDEAGEDINMDPEVEARLAPLLAQAAQRLLAGNQAQAAQQQAQKQAQDPLVQIQQQELQIKAADQKRKEVKDAADVQLKQEQLKLDQQLIAIIILQFIGFAIFWFSHSLIISLVTLFITGLGISMQFALSSLRLIGFSDKRPDLAIGISSLAAGSGIALAPFMLGVLGDQMGISRAYLMVPVLILIALAIVILVPSKVSPAEEESHELQN